MSKKVKYSNTFNNGLSSDTNELSQSNTVYTDAENVVLIPREDQDYILQNIKGNKIKGFLPEGYIPRAVKVFNDIAYIVSSKFDDKGNYLYTEIGTYPSPEWNNLLKERNILDVSDNELLPLVKGKEVSLANQIGNVYHQDDSPVEEVWSVRFDSKFVNHQFGMIDQSDFHYNDGYLNMATNRRNRLYETILSPSYRLIRGNQEAQEIPCSLMAPDIPNPDNHLRYLKYYELLFPNIGFGDTSDIVQDLINGNLANTKGILELDILFFEDNGSSMVLVEDRSTYGLYFKNWSEDVLTVRGGKSEPNTYADYLGSGGFCLEHDEINDSDWKVNLYDNWIGDSRYSDGVPSTDKPFRLHFVFKYKKHPSYNLEVFEPNKVVFRPVSTISATRRGVVAVTCVAKNYKGYIYERKIINMFALGYFYKRDCTNNNLEFYFNSNKNDDKDIYGILFTSTANKSAVSNIGDLVVPEKYTSDADYKNNIDDFYKGSLPRLLFKRFSYDISSIGFSSCGPYGEQSGTSRAYIGVSPMPLLKDTDGFFPGIVDITKSTHITNNDITTRDNSHNEKFLLSINESTNDIDFEIYCTIPIGVSSIGTYMDGITLDNEIGDDNQDLFHRIFKRLYDTNVHSVDYAILNGSSESKGFLLGFSNGFVVQQKGNRSRPINTLGASTEWYENLRTGLYTRDDLNLGNTLYPMLKIILDAVFIENMITDPSESSAINDLDILEDSKVLSITNCAPKGGNQEFVIENNSNCGSNNFNAIINVLVGCSYAGGISISSQYIYGNSITKNFSGTPGEQILFQLIMMNMDDSAIELLISSTVTDVISNYSIISVDSVYYCNTECNAHIVDKYHPIMNFNNHDITEIEMMDSNNYRDPFRTDRFIIDSEDGVDLEIQPHYDNTLNLIINDKKSKVKLINTRIAYDPTNKVFSIPQNSGINDNNVYCNEYANRMELILRSEKQMVINFQNTVIGGKVIGGNYVFYFRYIDADGNVTDIQAHSLNINAFIIKDDINNNEGVNAGEETNCKIPIRLENIDHSFSHIEVSFMISYGDESINREYFKLKQHLPITLDDFVNFEYNGIEDTIKLEYSELVRFFNHHSSVFTLEQSKNRLNLGNIKLSDISMYEDIQRLAIKYLSIEEVLSENLNSNMYKSARHIYHNLGYWRGETYQNGFILSHTKGGNTPVFLPKGKDNISGNAIYSPNAISDFSGAYGENPYGVYRTNINRPISGSNNIVNNDNDRINVLFLQLVGMDDFLDALELKYPNEFKGYTLVRTDRLRDAIVQGYSSSVFKMPFGPGYRHVEPPAGCGTGGNPPCPVSPDSYSEFNSEETFYDYDSAGGTCIDPIINSQNNLSTTGHYLMAPFNAVQTYIQNSDITDNKNSVPHLEGVSNNTAPDHLFITTKGLKGELASNEFAFISGDMNVDAESFAAEFNGSRKYYHASSKVSKFGNNIGNSITTTVGVDVIMDADIDYANIQWLRNKGEIKNTSKLLSSMSVSHYIPEDSTTSTDNFFSTKIDQTSMNFNTCAFIAVREDKLSKISKLLRLLGNSNGLYNNEFFALLTNVYNNDGPLNNSSWVETYLDLRNSNGFFPVSHSYPINRRVGDVLIASGDCYIGISNVRIIQHNGIKDNFSSYSNIWDYTGAVDGTDYMKDTLDLDIDPASLTWFTDSVYTMLQRARLVPKGLWVSMIHESNYNTMLRSSQFKDTKEKAIYGKDRTWMVTSKWLDTIGKDFIRREFPSIQLETKNYNKGYSNNNGALKYFIVTDYEKILRDYYTRIESSLLNIKNILKNNYREFYGLDHKDYDTKYGSIQKLIEFNNLLYVFNERSTSIVPLMEKVLTSESSGGVFTSQRDVLGHTLQVLSNSYGTIHPNSVIATLTGVYAYDYNNICITLTNGQGVTDISSYKIEKFLYEFNNHFKNLPTGYKMDVRTSYDRISGNVIFTFYILDKIVNENNCSLSDINKYDINYNNGLLPTDVMCCDAVNISDANDIGCIGEMPDNTEFCPLPESHRNDNDINKVLTLYFNERLKKWVSRLSYHPLFSFTLSKDLFSFNLLDNMNRIYMHESNDVNYCYYYDSQHTFSFEFIINKDSSVQKILDNFIIVSNRSIPMYIDYDMDIKHDLHTLDTYDIDYRQPIVTRRREVRIIGISDNYNFYLNVINRDNQDLIGTLFVIDGINYRIDSISLDLSLVGTEYEGLYILSISFDNGTGYTPLDNNSIFYQKVFGVILKIDKISITRSNSDYIEDILYVQVKRMNIIDGLTGDIISQRSNKEIRDKAFKIRIEYDGVDHTYIHAVISKLRLSLN